MSLKSRQKCFGSLIISVLLALIGGIFSPTFAALPDTGQTKCYNDTVEIPCPSPGQDFYGQDGNYTINPPSYTKLDANGNVLSDSATSWAMVKDNVTGLIWENKTTDGSIHDTSKQYTLDDAQNVFIAQLNISNFGGYNDWRIPTREELRSIADYSKYNPAINTQFFPTTQSSHYWSSSTAYYAGGDIGCYLNFIDGIDFANVKSAMLYVRAVRGDNIARTFTDNGNGTVTDNKTGLIWQQAAGNNAWKAALAYCENLSLAGYMDWRLPNIKELASLPDLSIYNPAIDTKYFPGYFSIGTLSGYWSSTMVSADKAFYMNFNYGYNASDVKSSSYYVRCVRGGLPPLPSPTITAITPNTGAGGTTVTITGTNFVAGSTSVSFGGSAATVSSVSATQIICTTPAHAVGTVDVKVTVMGVAEPATKVGGFTYTAPPTPTITSITPNNGSASGGTAVIITGTNFAPGSTVTFGGTAATVSNVTASQITCTTPAHAAGAVDVVVTVAGLSATKAGGFTYTAPTTTSAILTIDDVTAIQGTTNAAVRVSLNNPGVAVSSMQFDILYNATAGIHANGSYTLSSRTPGFTVSVTPSENGVNSKATVILYKLSGPIATGTGAIADILFNADSSAAVGTSTLSLNNCVLSDISANRITSDCTDTAVFRVGPSCSSLIGDINKDGAINILDLQVLINCIMGRGACNCCDLNNDSNNNIFDLQILINKIIAAVSTRSERDNGNNTLILPVIQTAKNGRGSFGLGLNNESAVASGEFVFTYDSTTGFNVTDVRLTSRTGNFSTDMTTDTADPKNVKIKVLLYSMGKTVTPGTGDILAFTYTTSANAAGNIALTFTAGKNFLSDSGAQSVNLTTQNGSVTVADVITGNVNSIGGVDLADAIAALQILAGLNPPNMNIGADVNNDGKIGLEEVIYVLQTVAGLRP